MNVQIDHINIAAPMDLLDGVRDFYCGLFGLENGFRPAFSQRGYWLYSGDQAIVHLSESSNHQRLPGKGHLDHVAFQAREPDLVIERLAAAGVPFRANYIPEIRLTQLFFDDPAGTGLEVNFPDTDPPA